MVQPLRPIRKPNHKKYVYLLNVSYLNIINIKHLSSRNESSKRENINQAVKYEEIFYFLDVMCNITPWNEAKFPEIAQRIYNATFVGVFQICLTRIKISGKNSTWINDLIH